MQSCSASLKIATSRPSYFGALWSIGTAGHQIRPPPQPSLTAAAAAIAMPSLNDWRFTADWAKESERRAAARRHADFLARLSREQEERENKEAHERFDASNRRPLQNVRGEQETPKSAKVTAALPRASAINLIYAARFPSRKSYPNRCRGCRKVKAFLSGSNWPTGSRIGSNDRRRRPKPLLD
jgi:hypothetical protein